MRGFAYDNHKIVDAESIRGAKEWLGARMTGGKYHPVNDQPAFSARMDLQQAYKNSRSFRKLCKEWKSFISKVEKR
jgi:hypothetical protein